MSIEYRVHWRRQERKRTTKIYQTHDAAHRKARGIVALERVKDETSMRDMPPLVEAPVIEQREVGEWAVAAQQAEPPRESEIQNMRAYFGTHEDDNYGPF